jgi:hypothetical protein
MEDNMLKTSWSDEDLKKLCEPTNHRIRYDGYEYVWEHRVNGNKWELHSVWLKDNFNKLYANMKFWLYQWSKELTERKIKSAESYFAEMTKYLKATEVAIHIKNSDLTTKAKIKEIKKELPSVTVKFLSDLLNISRQIIHRHIK